MPSHRDLLRLSPVEQRRALGKLLSLKHFLDDDARRPDGSFSPDGVPARTLDKSLLIATWNIRELGANKSYGPRLPESLHYIAEIISAFDLVAIQEVRSQVDDFKRLMEILGEHWGFLLTDVTLGKSGNDERGAFVYDRRKVHFEGFAGQVVLPPELKIGKKKLQLRQQLARTPLVAGFRAADFRFTVCSAHIYYGKKLPNEKRRVDEIEALATILAERVRSESAWAPTTVLLGDFNIFELKDETAARLRSAGFYLPPQVASLEAGETRKKYDQIALLSPRYEKQTEALAKKARGGVVRFFEKLFIDDAERSEWALYKSYFPDRRATTSEAAGRKYFRAWRTYQLSDHRPRWIELKSDFGVERLAALRHRVTKRLPARR